MFVRGFQALCLCVVLSLCVQATTFTACDIRQTGTTSVSDVQILINEALGVQAPNNDLNGDTTVSVADIQIDINAALNLGCSAGQQVSLPASITSFSPQSGPIGTSVTVTGANFGTAPQVTLPSQAGGTLGQPLATASQTSVTFVVAAGSATGAINLSNGTSSASSSAPFTVTPASNFSVAASPPSANLIMGQAVTYTVQLSSTSGFAQLASLGATGVPSGVTAAFVPTSITAGQSSILTLTAPANQPLSNNATVTITASATINGIPVSQSTAVALSVVAPTTALMGRTTAADNLETPLAGVTITTLGQDGNGNTTPCPTLTTTSDGGGNFVFTNLPMGCTGPQLFNFNGGTVTSPAGKYAGVNLVFTINEGKVTVSPINVHLPNITNAETFYVQQNASTDQNYSYSSIPGLKVTVYAGTTITMADGSQPNPYPLAALQIPADRLPDVKPQVPTMMMALIVAFQPENSTASQPIAVYYPNALNTAPGTDAALITLDPERGTMVPYGTGKVAPDGSDVIPDPDPAHSGHLYGLVRPGWHFFAPPPPPPPPGPPPPPNSCPVPGSPIYLGSGMDIIKHTDLEMVGNPLTLELDRILYTNTTYVGPFGVGGDHNFDLAIDTTSASSAAMFNLVVPFGARHVPFIRQTNGTLINSTDPAYLGAVFTTNSDNTAQLRMKTGVMYSFASNGGLSGIGDSNGNSITVSRNTSGEVSQVSDSLGRQLNFTYAVAHPPLIGSIEDSSGRTVGYTYDSGFHLTSFTDANGGVWKYSWIGGGLLASVTDPRGVVVEQNSYDTYGHVISQTEADGSTLQINYGYYNPTPQAAAGSPILNATLTDQLGRQSVYRFNAQAYVIQVIDAMGQTKSLARAPSTNLVLGASGPGTCQICLAIAPVNEPTGAALFDPTRGDMTYTYDGNGNALTKTDSLGNTFTYTYDPLFSRVTSITDPTGAITQYQYDSHGNLTGITDPLGNHTSITVGLYGLPTQVTDPTNQTTTFQYDAFGNLTGIRDALGETTTIAYDELFRPIQVTDPSGVQRFQTWDPLDRLIRATDGNGGVTVYTYDGVGNLLTVTDPRGAQVSYVYDSLSRVVKRTDALGRQEQFAYDALGNLTSHTDRRGQTSQFSFDSLNRLATETYPDASVARTYDANSHLIQVNDSQGGVFAYQFDSAGRLLGSVSPAGAITYTRDGLGRMASRQATGFPKVGYQFDSAGNLTQASAPQASVNLTYDARNLLASLSRSNGVSSTVTRDPLARISSIVHQAGSNPLAAFSYSYDPSGNRAGQSTGLAQALTTPATTGTFNLANEMSAFGGQSLTYDANGNRLTESGTGGNTSYTWDGRNRLASVSQPAGATLQFTYDFRGNLIQESATGGAGTAYLLDEATNTVAISSGGSPLSLLTGVAPDSHFATFTSAGNAEFSLRDGVGNIVASTGATAALDGTNYFEPFGQTTASGHAFPFAFAGRAPFAANSIYNFRTRFYDPLAGRFLSEAGTRFVGDPNRYRYLNNSPLSSTDPFGTSLTRDPFGSLAAWWRSHVPGANPGTRNQMGGVSLAPQGIQ